MLCTRTRKKKEDKDNFFMINPVYGMIKVYAGVYLIMKSTSGLSWVNVLT